jgi:hypothetical protein
MGLKWRPPYMESDKNLNFQRRRDFGLVFRSICPSFRRLLFLNFIAAIFSGCGFFSRESQIEHGLGLLHQAYAVQRPFQSRISGFSYAPFMGLQGDGAAKSDSQKLARSKRILLSAASKDRGSATMHALARFYLAGGEFSQAIDLLTRALQADDQNASLHCDLGAALLE